MKIVECKTSKDYQACGPTSFFVTSEGVRFTKDLDGSWVSRFSESRRFSDSLLAGVSRDVFVEDPEFNTAQSPYEVMSSDAIKIFVDPKAGPEAKRFAREIVARKVQVVKLQSVIRAIDPSGKIVEDLERHGVLGAYDMETPV